MSQRSDFQIQILEKLGAPLLIAVAEVAARQKKDGQGTEKQEATRVAELLGKAVQASVSLAGSMDLKNLGDQADSVRLALAAVAGPLVAGQYRITGKVPGDKEIVRLVKSLEAVLIFSDNFAPAIDNTARLESMEPGMVINDESQMNIQLVNMLVPVVNVIASFPFGRSENKLVQEVVDKLVRRAVVMREKFITGTGEQLAKQAELNILKSLSMLYVECHQEEMNKFMDMDEQARVGAADAAGGGLSMEPVWQAFETRAGMVEVICKSAMPVDGAAVQKVDVVAPVVASVPSPEETEVAALAASVVSAPVEPAPAAYAPEDADQKESEGSFNPMGAFGVKPVKSDVDEDTGEVDK